MLQSGSKFPSGSKEEEKKNQNLRIVSIKRHFDLWGCILMDSIFGVRYPYSPGTDMADKLQIKSVQQFRRYRGTQT
jgi:hypothetical protein